jgi:hypothetical protein
MRDRFLSLSGLTQYPPISPPAPLALGSPCIPTLNQRLQRGSYTKSDPIAPFWVLVVETFRRNVSTKWVWVAEKGGSRPGFGIIAPPFPPHKINNFHEDDYGALLCVSEV